MPHDQPWLDDYQTRHQAELQARWNEEAKVFQIQNQAMKTALAECPFELRTPETCRECGNESCIKAWKEQQKLWGDDNEEPVCHVNTTSTRQDAAPLPAQSKSEHTQTSRHPGRPASGIDLFDLMDDQEKAA